MPRQSANAVIDLGDEQQDLADFLEDQNATTGDDDGEGTSAEPGLADLIDGVDNALKSTKRVMRPQPKLDEARLTNAENGLPVLPKLFANWKPDPKRDEFQNLDDIMNRIEHWAHCLFPKMKFADFIDRAEHLGHKRAVQTCLTRIRNDMPLTDEDYAKNDEIEENTAVATDTDDAVMNMADSLGDDDDDDELMLLQKQMMTQSQPDNDIMMTSSAANANTAGGGSSQSTSSGNPESSTTTEPAAMPKLPLTVEEKRRKALELREKRLKRIEAEQYAAAVMKEEEAAAPELEVDEELFAAETIDH